MRLLVEFGPPDASHRLDELKPRLATVPPDAIRIDTGRTRGGTFVRVWLLDETFGDDLADIA